MSYRNVDGWVVIQDDDRDPHLSFNHHRARGSLGGVDCVAAVGTPVHAPADGTAYTGLAGTGGNTVTLAQPGGWHDQFMHLSRYAVANGTAVKQGDLLGYTGATGTNGAVEYVPHLHWHRIDPAGTHSDAWGSTNRRVPWDYFDSSALAGGGITVIIMAINGNLDSDDDKGVRAILQRSLKYHVRENETSGATIWERFASVQKSVTDGFATVAAWCKNQDTRREAINERQETIHTGQDGKLDAILAAVKPGVPVTVKVDEAFADLVASKVAAKIPAAATPDAVREIVQSELAALVLAPRA